MSSQTLGARPVELFSSRMGGKHPKIAEVALPGVLNATNLLPPSPHFHAKRATPPVTTNKPCGGFVLAHFSEWTVAEFDFY